MPEYLDTEEELKEATELSDTDSRIIEVRSEQVQEILSHVPNWIIRWGITVILASVLAIIVGSYFIKYPDALTARIVLTSERPPTDVLARASGRLKFFVEDNDLVKEGDYLGLVENPANTEHILGLIDKIRPYRGDLFFKRQDIYNTQFEEDLSLGSIQNSYIRFINLLQNYNTFMSLDFTQKQVNDLEANLNFQQARRANLVVQKQAADSTLKYRLKTYLTDSTLLTQGASYQEEVDNARVAYFNAASSVKSLESSIISLDEAIAGTRQQISTLNIRRQDEESSKRIDIEGAFRQLKSDLMNWEQQYLLKAPIEGRISLSTYWTDNQNVQAGTEVMTVIPDSLAAGDYLGQVMVPVAGSGKIELGQKVNIKFDNFPNDEYGIVLGQVESMSEVPITNPDGISFYVIRISLPNGLTSSYKKQLDFKPEMQGTADIITEDLRLLERVFNQLRALLDAGGEE